MATKKNPKKPADPKARHVWEINPKTRVNDSDKGYSRPEEKKKEKSWVNDVSWFGEVKKKPTSPFDFLPAKEDASPFPVEEKKPSFELPQDELEEELKEFDDLDEFNEGGEEKPQEKKDPKKKLSRSEREALNDDDFGLDDF